MIVYFHSQTEKPKHWRDEPLKTLLLKPLVEHEIVTCEIFTLNHGWKITEPDHTEYIYRF